MATITVSQDYSFNQTDFDFSELYYGASYVRSGNLFRVNYGNGYIEDFVGSGFTYNANGEPISGTVTSYTAFYSGQMLVSMEGAVAMTSILAAAQTVSTNDDAGVIIQALKGNDTLSGGIYVDVLMGFDGNDVISGNYGDDILYGDDGNDVIIGGADEDQIDGGTGTDTASYFNSSFAIIASLSNTSLNTSDAAGDKYFSIENLHGSRYNDFLYGNGGANSLNGGDGHDTLIGGAGADKLIGATGIDAVSYAGAAAGVIADLGNASANTGEAAGDTYSSIENIGGSSYGDMLFGNSGANGLSGGNGNDALAGRAGDDTLYGGAGADRLTGGTGADRFIFKSLPDSAGAAYDTILDFMTSEQDRIDLSSIDANSPAGGNQAFTFVNTAAFSGVAGELRYDKLASDSCIYADVNGDKKADLAVRLDDAVTLTKDYFIL